MLWNMKYVGDITAGVRMIRMRQKTSAAAHLKMCTFDTTWNLWISFGKYKLLRKKGLFYRWERTILPSEDMALNHEKRGFPRFSQVFWLSFHPSHSPGAASTPPLFLGGDSAGATLALSTLLTATSQVLTGAFLWSAWWLSERPSGLGGVWGAFALDRFGRFLVL